MIKVSIHYPDTDGGRFDSEYYFNTQMPLSIRLAARIIVRVRHQRRPA